MAQFDVYRNANAETSVIIPYLLDVQADLLGGLATRVVVPLYRQDVIPRPIQHLHPGFVFLGEKLVLSTAEMAGVPRAMLAEPAGSLAEHRDRILAALGFTFTGI
ncbi:MAG TPA: CcdB family protein [Mariprofundaceae bacterium]|nr:CcdB family protein [Mariprofundaceae bacterium]